MTTFQDRQFLLKYSGSVCAYGRLDVDTTFFGHRQHCRNVETTSCDYWAVSKNHFMVYLFKVLIMIFLKKFIIF